MRHGQTLTRTRMIFDALVVIASIVASIVTGLFVPIALIAVLVLLGGSLTYIEHKKSLVQSQSDSLRKLLEENVLADLIDEYENAHPDSDPPQIRVNVMFLRRRNLSIFNRGRGDVWPWQRTLQIEAAYGDYESTSEDELEWKPNEGVVGRAMNEAAQEIWATLDYDDQERIKQGWNLTDPQVERTSHLTSLLCTPIYLPSDNDKSDPVGVLNLDCEEPLSRSRFEDEAVRDKIINSANVIGGIVE